VLTRIAKRDRCAKEELMAVAFEYDIDGSHVTSLDDLQDDDMRDMLQEVSDELMVELADVRCPEHGAEPTIIITPTGDEGFGVTVEGCCEVLATLVEDRIEEIYEVEGEEDE
jgi:hypothetical protein